MTQSELTQRQIEQRERLISLLERELANLIRARRRLARMKLADELAECEHRINQIKCHIARNKATFMRLTEMKEVEDE